MFCVRVMVQGIRARTLFSVFLVSLLVTSTLYAESPQDTYEAVLAGKTCKEDRSTQTIECEYVVGKGLHFVISGMGQPDTGILFLKSSSEEDYFASFGVLHGCVIVNRCGGAAAQPEGSVEDLAFVSPKNGKVYRNWEQCKEGW